MLLRFFLLTIMTMSSVIDSQKYVAIEVENADSMVAENGKPFSFSIRVKPASGIHVNAQPPLYVKSLADGVTMNFKPVQSLGGQTAAGEYLDLSKPLRVECNIMDMAIGRHKIDFVISYTYCSEEGKWCRFGNDTTAISVRVEK
ncbi:MAG: hypothetical protein ACLP05_06095 [Candidatus Kryptoniota bacterium]